MERERPPMALPTEPDYRARQSVFLKLHPFVARQGTVPPIVIVCTGHFMIFGLAPAVTVEHLSPI